VATVRAAAALPHSPSPVPPPRSRRGAAPGRRPRPAQSELTTRERVLRAAVRVFTERGFDATSMREIAARAGVTKPVIYYYFQGKKELYASLLRHVLEATDKVFAAEAARRGPAAARLRSLVATLVRLCREEPELARFVYQVFSYPSALPLGFDYQSLGHRISGRLEDLIRDGQRRGELRRVDPSCAVMMLHGAVHFYVAAHLSGVQPALNQRTAASLVSILVRGLAAENAR
jgi:AcrR family transcriptional regulator